ncbi:MAG: 3'-5' exonuclease [Candidatus Omnitrophica bacterium]|nr:3'-5' exonuclease [Candidatus Omnitrophota bacterium]
MPENIDEIEITIFDTETTGLKPEEGDRMVELAALKVRAKERIAVFDELINPGRAISAGAFSVNKITPEMLKGVPEIGAVMPKFLDFTKGSCLCSYNAEFDMSFLNNELKLIGLPAINNILVLDVLTMARKLLPGLARYPLWFVAQKLEIRTVQQHRALADVEMTWEVFTKLKALCQEKGIADLASFSNLFAFKPKFDL